MKNLLVFTLFTFMLFCANSSFAQFGVRAGASFANFNDFDLSSRTGLHLGGYYQFDLADNFVIEPGIYYAQKGFRSDFDDIQENLNYLDIPILVRYQILELINVFAGPQGSVVIARKNTNRGVVSTSTAPVKAYDLAAVVGAGVNLPLGFNFQVSYDLGLVNLNYFDFDVKNRGLKLSVGKSF